MNLVHKACCNGYYIFHGLKASAVLHDDGIRHVHIDSLQGYDSVALHRSKMIGMIKLLYTEDDLRTPKVSSDSDCDSNEVNQSRHTDVELSILNE